MTPFLSALDETIAAALPAFVQTQRWFAGKARGPCAITVEDVAPLGRAAGDHGTALVIVRAAFETGAPETYTLLIAAVEDPGTEPVIAPRGAWPGPGVLIEATGHETSARRMLAGFSRTAAPTTETREGGLLVFGDMPEGGVFETERPPGVRALGAEQSNTSLLVNDRYVFKLFRRFEPGENPEVEVGRFLTARTGFRAMPVLHGSLGLMGGGITHTVGVLQSFVRNDGDGWRWALAQLEQGGPARISLEPALRTLGETTAAFHTALASRADDPDFAPRPLAPTMRDAWARDVQARLARTLDLLTRAAGTLPAAARSLAEQVIAERPGLERRATPPDLAHGGFDTIRTHGDYHLGQVLKVASGFVLMDFEGEPARPLAERRAHASALRDVAGMLRSLDYAVVAAHLDDRGLLDSLREAFLSGYLAGARSGSFLPGARAAREAWTAFFELEKALYEVEYEVNNRPDWLPIPLHGILGILKSS